MKSRRNKTCCSLVLLCFSFTLLYAQPDNQPVEISAEMAVMMAMNNNRNIKALDHQLKGTEYDVKSAITNFLPDVSLSGQYTRLSKQDDLPSVPGGMSSGLLGMGMDMENTYNFGLQIQQPIFTGFQILNGLRSAKLSHTLQEMTNDRTRQTIKFAVLQIYWGLASLQKSQTVASEAKRQLEELASNQEAMMEQGMTTEHDYLLTKASLAQAEMNELNVIKSLKSMNRQFALLLGIPVNSKIILTDSTAGSKEITTNNVDSLITSAYMERPDLKETCFQLQLSDLGIKAARASYYPSLYAGFSYSNSRPDNFYRDQWGDSWTLYASLNFTLWDWGNRAFKVKKAKEQKLSLVELFEQKKADIESDVLDALSDVNLSSKALEVAQLMADAREKNYHASLAKHEEGVISTYELLDTHNSYISAQYQALQAATNLELAVINLEMDGIGKTTDMNQTSSSAGGMNQP